MVHSLPTTPAVQELHEEDTGVLKKQIKSLRDIDNFQTSPTYNQFLGFILELNEAVIGKPLSFQCHISPVCLVAPLLSHYHSIISRLLTF